MVYSLPQNVNIIDDIVYDSYDNPIAEFDAEGNLYKYTTKLVEVLDSYNNVIYDSYGNALQETIYSTDLVVSVEDKEANLPSAIRERMLQGIIYQPRVKKSGLNYIYNGENISEMKDRLKIRTVPYGAPKTRDNESHNPGRHQFGANNGNSYGFFEGMRFLLLDDLSLGELNKRSEWQSGPANNINGKDVYTLHSGWWTCPGGENVDWDNMATVDGNPNKFSNFASTNTKEDPILLYDVGHGTQSSEGLSGQSEGVEYGCIGYSGYIKPEYHNYWIKKGRTSEASVAIRYAYASYRSDVSDSELSQILILVDKLKDFLEELLEELGEINPEDIIGSLEDFLNTGQLFNKPVNINDLNIASDEQVKRFKTRFRGMVFQNNFATRQTFQMIAESIINKKGQEFPRCFYLLEELFSTLRTDGKINGEKLLDWIAGLYFASDKEYDFRRRLKFMHILDPYFILNANPEIADNDQIAFCYRCVRNGGFLSYENKNWQCAMNDDIIEYEPIVPDTVAASTTPFTLTDFQRYCMNQGGDIDFVPKPGGGGNDEVCVLLGSTFPMTQLQYNNSINGFIEWCNINSGYSQVLNQDPKRATCELTYIIPPENVVNVKNWCDRQDGGLYSETYKGCFIKGMLTPYTEEHNKLGGNGFSDWCNENGGSAVYIPDKLGANQTKQFLSMEGKYQQVNDNGDIPFGETFNFACYFKQENINPLFNETFASWCNRTDNGVLVLRNNRLWCENWIFQGNKTYEDIYPGYPAYRPPSGLRKHALSEEIYLARTEFRNWCSGAGGRVEGTPYCAEEFANDNSELRERCVFDFAPNSDLSLQSHYSNDPMGGFRTWCTQNNGTHLSSGSAATCSIGEEKFEIYNIQGMCETQNGSFFYNATRNRYECRFLKENPANIQDYEERIAPYLEKDHVDANAFRYWCMVTNSDLDPIFDTPLGDSTTVYTCDFNLVENRDPAFFDWCNDNGGKFSIVNNEGVCDIQPYRNKITETIYRSDIQAFDNWCTSNGALTSTKSVGADTIHTCTLFEELGIPGDFESWCRKYNGRYDDALQLCHLAGADNVPLNHKIFKGGYIEQDQWCEDNGGILEPYGNDIKNSSNLCALTDRNGVYGYVLYDWLLFGPEGPETEINEYKVNKTDFVKVTTPRKIEWGRGFVSVENTDVTYNTPRFENYEMDLAVINHTWDKSGVGSYTTYDMLDDGYTDPQSTYVAYRTKNDNLGGGPQWQNFNKPLKHELVRKNATYYIKNNNPYTISAAFYANSNATQPVTFSPAIKPNASIEITADHEYLFFIASSTGVTSDVEWGLDGRETLVVLRKISDLPNGGGDGTPGGDGGTGDGGDGGGTGDGGTGGGFNESRRAYRVEYDSITGGIILANYNQPIYTDKVSTGTTYSITNNSTYEISPRWFTRDSGQGMQTVDDNIIQPGTTLNVTAQTDYVAWGAVNTSVDTDAIWGVDGRTADIQFEVKEDTAGKKAYLCVGDDPDDVIRVFTWNQPLYSEEVLNDRMYEVRNNSEYTIGLRWFDRPGGEGNQIIDPVPILPGTTVRRLTLGDHVCFGAGFTDVNSNEEWGLDGRTVDISLKYDDQPITEDQKLYLCKSGNINNTIVTNLYNQPIYSDTVVENNSYRIQNTTEYTITPRFFTKPNGLGEQLFDVNEQLISKPIPPKQTIDTVALSNYVVWGVGEVDNSITPPEISSESVWGEDGRPGRVVLTSLGSTVDPDTLDKVAYLKVDDKPVNNVSPTKYNNPKFYERIILGRFYKIKNNSPYDIVVHFYSQNGYQYVADADGQKLQVYPVPLDFDATTRVKIIKSGQSDIFEALEEFVVWGACNTKINNEEQWGLDGRPVDIDLKLDQEPEGPVANVRVAYLNGNDSLNQQPDFDFGYNTPIYSDKIEKGINYAILNQSPYDLQLWFSSRRDGAGRVIRGDVLAAGDQTLFSAPEDYVLYGAWDTLVKSPQEWGLNGRPVDITLRPEEDIVGIYPEERKCYRNDNDSIAAYNQNYPNFDNYFKPFWTDDIDVYTQYQITNNNKYPIQLFLTYYENGWEKDAFRYPDKIYIYPTYTIKANETKIIDFINGDLEYVPYDLKYGLWSAYDTRKTEVDADGEVVLTDQQWGLRGRNTNIKIEVYKQFDPSVMRSYAVNLLPLPGTPNNVPDFETSVGYNTPPYYEKLTPGKKYVAENRTPGKTFELLFYTDKNNISNTPAVRGFFIPVDGTLTFICPENASYFVIAEHTYNPSTLMCYTSEEYGKNGRQCDIRIRAGTDNDVVSGGALYRCANDNRNSEPNWNNFKNYSILPVTPGRSYRVKNNNPVSIQPFFYNDVNETTKKPGVFNSYGRTIKGSLTYDGEGNPIGLGNGETVTFEIPEGANYVAWGGFNTGIASDSEWGENGRFNNITVTIIGEDGIQAGIKAYRNKNDLINQSELELYDKPLYRSTFDPSLEYIVRNKNNDYSIQIMFYASPGDPTGNPSSTSEEIKPNTETIITPTERYGFIGAFKTNVGSFEEWGSDGRITKVEIEEDEAFEDLAGRKMYLCRNDNSSNKPEWNKYNTPLYYDDIDPSSSWKITNNTEEKIVVYEVDKSGATHTYNELDTINPRNNKTIKTTTGFLAYGAFDTGVSEAEEWGLGGRYADLILSYVEDNTKPEGRIAYINNNDRSNQPPNFNLYNKPIYTDSVKEGKRYDIFNGNDYPVQIHYFELSNAQGTPKIADTVPANESRNVTIPDKYKYICWGAYNTTIDTESVWGLNGRSTLVEISETDDTQIENPVKGKVAYLNEDDKVDKKPEFSKYKSPVYSDRIEAGDYDVTNLNRYRIQLWYYTMPNASGESKKGITINGNDNKVITIEETTYIHYGAYKTDVLEEEDSNADQTIIWGIEGRSTNVAVTEVTEPEEGGIRKWYLNKNDSSKNRPEWNKYNKPIYSDKIFKDHKVDNRNNGPLAVHVYSSPSQQGFIETVKVSQSINQTIKIPSGQSSVYLSYGAYNASGMTSNSTPEDWGLDGRECKIKLKPVIDTDKPGDNGGGSGGGSLSDLADWAKYLAYLIVFIEALDHLGINPEATRRVDIIADLVNKEPSSEYEFGRDKPVAAIAMLPTTHAVYFNYTVDEKVKPALRLLRCRQNGVLFHLTNPGTATGGMIRNTGLLKLAPTYGFGVIQDESTSARKILRKWESDKTVGEIRNVTRFKLDMRYNYVEDLQPNWKPGDMWFKPLMADAIKSTKDKLISTMGIEKYYTGKNGLDLPGGGKDPGSWTNCVTLQDHFNEYKFDPGMFMKNIFNDGGHGGKFKGMYNDVGATTDHQCFNYEIQTTDEPIWPLNGGYGYPGVEFFFKIPNLTETNGHFDIQLNYVHLHFHSTDAEGNTLRKSIEMKPDTNTSQNTGYQYIMPQKNDTTNTKTIAGGISSSDYPIYITRQSWDGPQTAPNNQDRLGSGSVGGMQGGQRWQMAFHYHKDMGIKMVCSPTTIPENIITPEWRFVSLSMNIWVGKFRDVFHWSAFTISDLKPRIWIP